MLVECTFTDADEVCHAFAEIIVFVVVQIDGMRNVTALEVIDPFWRGGSAVRISQHIGRCESDADTGFAE